MMTPTRVEMKQTPPQIMETSISKPWVTYWYSDRAQLTSQILSREATMKQKMQYPKVYQLVKRVQNYLLLWYDLSKIEVFKFSLRRSIVRNQFKICERSRNWQTYSIFIILRCRELYMKGGHDLITYEGRTRQIMETFFNSIFFSALATRPLHSPPASDRPSEIHGKLRLFCRLIKSSRV